MKVLEHKARRSHVASVGEACGASVVVAVEVVHPAISVAASVYVACCESVAAYVEALFHPVRVHDHVQVLGVHLEMQVVVLHIHRGPLVVQRLQVLEDHQGQYRDQRHELLEVPQVLGHARQPQFARAGPRPCPSRRLLREHPN